MLERFLNSQNLLPAFIQASKSPQALTPLPWKEFIVEYDNEPDAFISFIEWSRHERVNNLPNGYWERVHKQFKAYCYENN